MMPSAAPAINANNDTSNDPLSQTESAERTRADSARVRSADAALILTLAGVGWEMCGLSAFGGIPLLLLLPVAVVFVVLLVATLRAQRRLRHIVPAPRSSVVRRVFTGAVAFEVVAIVLAVVVAGVLHKPALILPAVAIAVGLHFFPLAWVLRRPLYVFTGAALCALGVGVPLLVSARRGAGTIDGWRLVLGLVGGGVVWLTAVALLVRSRMLPAGRTRFISAAPREI